MNNLYENETALMQIVKLGRRMIDKCEFEEAFKDDDEMWNNAVTAGNRLCTIGTTLGYTKVLQNLTHQETKSK